MEMVALTCQNPHCLEPNWSRPPQRGRLPSLCPPCKTEKEKTSEIPQVPRTEFQELVCSGDNCPEPNWKREWRPGALPTLCPTCREAKATVDEPTMQELVCGNPACPEPKWSRPRTRGASPKFCPNCRNTEPEEEEEVVGETVIKCYDPVIFSGKADEIEKAMLALQARYQKTEFYVVDVKEVGEERTIRLKPKYGATVSQGVIEGVRKVAETATKPAEITEVA